MSGAGHRRKGSRIEREVVALHNGRGIACKRVPLSGAAPGFKGDLTQIAHKFTAEVKARKNGQGWATIESWLGTHDLLFLRQDRRNPIVVMPLDVYFSLLEAFVKQTS